jgi:hypothetical protein
MENTEEKCNLSKFTLCPTVRGITLHLKDNSVIGDITLYVRNKFQLCMSKDNTTVGEKLFMWRIKGDHHSVFGHIPVQKEKYYIIRNLEIDCNTYIQRALLALGRKIDIFKLIYRYLLAFGR